MAGGLRATELTHLRWRDLDLTKGELTVARSKTAAGLRRVSLEPELVQLLREHKIASRWSQPDDFVFPGRDRDKPRDRNSVRKRALYGAIDAGERAASPPRASRRFPTASPSTRCAGPTPRCAPSSGSTRRSRLRRWATAIRG